MIKNPNEAERIIKFLINNGFKILDQNEFTYANDFLCIELSNENYENEIVILYSDGNINVLPFNLYALFGFLLHHRYISLQYEWGYKKEAQE